MATVKWLNNVNGLWTDPTKWSTGLLPGPVDDVVIDRRGKLSWREYAHRSLNSTPIQKRRVVLLEKLSVN